MARQALRDRGLPRARPEYKKRDATTLNPETEAERLAGLQESLRVTLRQLDGVTDAAVQIALPPPSYSMGDQPPTTASVKVEMQIGRQLSRAQVDGIVAIVSASVTGLEPEHVQVVDQSGCILTHQPEDLQQELMGNLLASLELSQTQKAQSLLDRSLGPGHGFVSLTYELDTSEIEIRRKTSDPKSYVVLQRRKEVETLSNGPQDVGSQMSTSSSRNYNKICEITKGEADQNYYVKVERQPRIARISCAVSLDRAAEAERVRELIKGAVGINEERGDFLTVQTITPVIAVTDTIAPEQTAAPAEQTSQFSGMALGAGFLLAGLAALFAAGMAPRRSQPELEMSGRSTLVDIKDLRSTSVDHETSIHQTQRIEEYVRQVPNRAAATLKELWLQ
jgi:flagellar M-ring protein FliF